MPKFLSAPALPVVSALPPAGDQGRMVVLNGDKHVYHDNGVSWDDLSVSATFNVPWVRTGSSAYHIAGDAVGANLGTLALTASRIYYIPFAVPKKITLTQMGFSVTTLSAGTARVGIYANDGSGATDVPGALLAEGASTLDTSTTGTKLASISITLDPGVIYWAAVICSSAATIRALTVASVSSALGRTSNATTVRSHVYQAGSGSTLPATAGAVTYNTGSNPALYIVD